MAVMATLACVTTPGVGVRGGAGYPLQDARVGAGSVEGSTGRCDREAEKSARGRAAGDSQGNHRVASGIERRKTRGLF